ncbi:2-succinyl-5-enolpyruvyl-6-hydroxy-3-cyclohexene-1-carboxylic-acid synthase [Corynebacterium bovis]|uniref:2-succinyl-5-enolpyruvyl-6-hydroxy-3- cyclohexene-1-carboxylic-acid synthase n=1 Tax=Corynebacterium bovis TaxID=36808 RepID=UPI0031329A30
MTHDDHDLPGASAGSAGPHPADPTPPAVTVAATVVDELVRCGVTDAVVCPGSRSAPLALALAEAARTGRLRLHVRTDERSAAFLALGVARRSRRVVPVVMTSGTAVANCLPAMVEATASGVPLLVLSANRPLDVLGTGANQTIDQAGIFGAHAVASLSLDAAVTGGSAPAVRSRVDAAVEAALDPSRGGGVQLDIPFAPPLVPADSATVSLAARRAASDGTGDPWRASALTTRHGRPSAAAGAAARARFGEVTVDLSRRTLVIAGSVRDEVWGRAMAEALADVPTVAEPTAPVPGTPVHPAGAAVFGATEVSANGFSAAVRPEQVVVLGRPTLHRPVTALLTAPDIDVVALTDGVTVPDVGRTVRRVGGSVTLTGEHPAGWTDVCAAVDSLGAEAVRDALAAPGPVTGLHVAAVVADALRDGDALVAGASSAVRDLSFAGLPFDGVRTLSARGAAGIDGTVSAAVGTALAHAAAHPDEPRAPRTVALMGDLTFLHDVNGLAIGADEPRPGSLVIVVADDRGGAIFEGLEPGAGPLREFDDGTPAFDRVFGTPPRGDVAALCAAFDVAHVAVDSVADLARVLDDHAEAGEDAVATSRDHAPGILVVEARVDRASRRDLEARIRDRVEIR